MSVMPRALLALLLVLALASSAVAGLHFTPAEIAIWQARRTAGPYAVDYTARILPRATTFHSDPTEETWAGNQLNVHWDAHAVDAGTQPPNAHPGRRQGDGLRDAGFVYLLTGDTSYRDAVRTALLAQAAVSGTVFSNTTKWNPASTVLDGNNFTIINWLRKLTYGYSYVRDSLSGGDRTTLDAWFLQAATYWNTVLDNQIQGRFPNRHSDDYTTLNPTFNPGSVRGTTHWGGPTVYSFHGCWENIPATTAAMVGGVGVLLEHATLKAHAARFFREWVRFAVAADGTTVDQYRWHTGSTNPAQLGFNYAGTVLGSMAVLADHFARAGDTSLYDYTTTAGNFGWSGGPKGLLLALRRYAQMTLGERGLPNGILVYASDDSSLTTDERIGPSTTHANDIWQIPANVYYKDPLYKQAYTRVLPTNPATGGYDSWGGDWGTYPGIRFLFGLQENVVFPYPTVPSSTPDVTTALRLHLKFDEGTGTTAQDSTGNAQDGILENGASWGAARMGASALVLDGTNDHVTVSGLLTSPAALTLAAWVLPSTYGTGGADVVSLGNVVTLRVTATQVLAHYWNGTAFTVLSASRPAGATWQHVAYTATAGAQRLYVNGGVVASGNAGAGLAYTGQGSHTLIGTHGNAGTVTRFGGAIDDVRVYTRALSATDMAGLAALDDPPPLSLLITSPTTDESLSTSAALLATVGGVASDATGVTSVTWTCPTCTPASGAADCTPACGASTTFTNWHIAALTLATGSNLLTVAATDASGTHSDTLTITYTPIVAGACTHYASPTGTGNGLSPGSPYQVVQFLSAPQPGQTLCLLESLGYVGNNSMVVPPAGVSGTAELPITVRALTDGTVLLDGQQARNPVVLGPTNAWWVVEGLNARNGLTGVYHFLGPNTLGKRLVGWQDTGGAGVPSVFTILGAGAVLEDAVGWGAQVQTVFLGSGTVSAPNSGCRRCWCEWSSLPSGSSTPGACYAPGVDQRFENVLGTLRETGP